MPLSLDASEDELMAQTMRQSPPSNDSEYLGQPELGDDFGFDSMPDISMSTPPLVGGNGGDMDMMGSGGLAGVLGNNGAMFGVPPGMATPPLQQQADQQKNEKASFGDTLLNGIAEGAVSLFKYFIEVCKSFKNRNIEDWFLIANTWLTMGSVASVVGLLMIVIGMFGNISGLKLGGLGGTSLISGLATIAFGIGGMGISTYLRVSGGAFSATGGSFEDLAEFSTNNVAEGGFDQIKDSDTSFLDDYDEDEEDEDNDEYEDLLKDLGIISDGKEEVDNMFSVEDETPKATSGDIDYNNLVDSVQENVPLITRKMLWDVFKPYFPLLTPGFAKRDELDTSDNTSLVIGSKINKALKILSPKALDEDTECIVTKVIETFFSYEVTFTRPKVKVNLTNLETELVNYFRDDSDDIVDIRVKVVGDTYIATIPKGVAAPITIGDCFSVPEVEEYFKSEKRQFPFIVGVTQLGGVELLDAKSITSFLISGKPRSGKSSYVNSILFELTSMNTPEDIQFVVIDPKNSMLFQTFALMPHVAGLHGEDEVIPTLKAVLDEEGARRKKLLSDNRCENIWELRNRKNIRIPILYVLIDEVVSVMEHAKLEGTDGTIKSLISMILTQLPSTGIGLILIPHRSTGILNPLTRNNIAFRCAVMADTSVVEEELGVKKWLTPLTKPGEIAALNTSYSAPKYVKGTCPVDPSLGEEADAKIRDLMANIARTWYKMGVELPDMSSLKGAFNRDEGHIREELEISLNPNKIQYDLDLDGTRD